MTWKGIVGKGFTATEFAQYVADLKLADWRPQFVVVHNTSAPDLALYHQWLTRPNWTGEQWMKNLASYYSGMGWSGGPHLFVAPDKIWAFTPMTMPGTHSPSWNSKTIGIETVGEFEREPFGNGSQENLIAALSIVHKKFELDPADYKFGVRGLHFHKEDPKTTHKTCPGKNMVKAELLADVVAQMAGTDSETAGEKQGDVPAAIQDAPTTTMSDAEMMSPQWLQEALNRSGAHLTVDGLLGPATKAAVIIFQRAHGLAADGIAGPLTRAALKTAQPPPKV